MPSVTHRAPDGPYRAQGVEIEIDEDLLKDLIHLSTAAELLDVHEQTVRRAIADGHVRAFRIGVKRTGSIRVVRADILALVRPIPTASAR